MRRLATIGSLTVLATGLLFAQATPVTTGFMHAIHATNTLEKTAEFYKEVFGLSSAIRPFANAAVAVLNNAPGVTLKVSMLNLPGQGMNFELTEFGNVERHPGAPRLSDPGAPNMKFLVRSIDTVAGNVKRVGARILTRSGAPVVATTMLGKTKAIFFTDPDGYIVEAIEATPAPDAPAGNVVGAIMGVTVGDMDKSMKFWRDTLGFELTGDPKFSTDPAVLDLMGIEKGGSFRSVSGVVPNSKARIEFTEFKGMPRAPFSLKTVDPGACGMALRVSRIGELLEKLKADGIRVSSRNGELVEWSETLRNVFIKDPDGLNLELVGNADPTK